MASLMVLVSPLRSMAQFTMGSGELACVKDLALKLWANQVITLLVNSMKTNGKAMEYSYSVQLEIDTQGNSRMTSSMDLASSTVRRELYTWAKLEIASITATGT